MECNYKNTEAEILANQCFHYHILIEQIEVEDGAGQKKHMCRYVCQDCGKIVLYCKDLNYDD